jgi:hypothetical protein
VLVMVKVLEKWVTEPPTSVVKLPDSVKVPGKGPAAEPLTEKLKVPALVGTLQCAGQRRPPDHLTGESLAHQRGGRSQHAPGPSPVRAPEGSDTQSAAATAERAPSLSPSQSHEPKQLLFH